MLSYFLNNMKTRQQKQQVRRSSGNDFLVRRFAEAFEPYREAFILGDTHQQNFIINEFVSSLLSVESCKLAQEQALVNCCRDDEPLEEILTCTLCREIFHNPVTLICGHTFCLECLASSQHQQRSVCPDCGQGSSVNYMTNIVVRELSQIWFLEKTSVRSTIAEAENLLNKGRITEFMALVDTLLNKYPENVDLLYLRAGGFMRVNRNNEALKDLEFACSLAPFNSKVLHKRGELLASIDEPGEAMEMFLRAAALKPNNPIYCSSVTSYFEKLLMNISCLTCPSQNPTYNNGEYESRLLKSLPLKSQVKVEATAMTERSSSSTSRTELIEQRNVPVCCTVKTNECSHATNTTVTQREVNVPQSELQCKLCFNLIYKPVTTPCGHSFCHSCLRRSLDHRLQCPCCRTNLQSYLGHLLQGNIGSCEVLEKILFLKFKADYEGRRKSYETELMQFSRYENTVEIPIFVCTLAVPNIACPLHIFEPRYKLMLRRCLESGSRQFGMCVSDPENGFATVGTMLYINDVNFMPDGRSIVHTVGSRRFQVLERGSRDGYSTAKVAWLEDECDEGDYKNLNNQVYNTMLKWYEKLPNEQQTCIWQGVGAIPGAFEGTNKNGPKWLWWLLVAMPLNVEARHIILSMTSVIERLNSVKRFLEILISRQ